MRIGGIPGAAALAFVLAACGETKPAIPPPTTTQAKQLAADAAATDRAVLQAYARPEVKIDKTLCRAVFEKDVAIGAMQPNRYNRFFGR